MTQVGVSITRHRELKALEHMGGKGEYLIHITTFMKGDTHARSYC